AARGADDGCLVEVVQGHEIEDVEQFDERRVVLPMPIILRAAAPAVVDAIYGPRPLRMVRQVAREIMEIAAVAGEARKTDDGPGFAIADRIVPHVQAQIVE